MTNMEYTDLGIERKERTLLMAETETKENIITTSQKYVRQLNDIRRSIYIGECVNVKYQDSNDRTGTICYIHKNGTYFNVKFDDTGVQESYFPSDVLEGIVLIDKKGVK